MGWEFVPLSSRAAAEEFIAKNGGTIYVWNEVSPEMVQNLRK
jgi:nitrous oxide reductase accessory protein NosL